MDPLISPTQTLILSLSHAVQEQFIQELIEIHETYTEQELVIAGEYATEETMSGWGWSELLGFSCFVGLQCPSCLCCLDNHVTRGSVSKL